MPSTITIVYHAFAFCVYGCILAILVLALVFGRRARRNVKKERVTHLPEGFSPLDVQRVFIGKTYPKRLTKALLVYWARRGYIKLEYVDRNTVRIIKLKDMPRHNSKNAVFYDRGTYVRECELFKILTVSTKVGCGKPVSLLKPLFTRQEVSRINSRFAVREDDGVYSAKHYTLKIITMILSVLPFALCAVWLGIYTGNFAGLVLLGTALIGMCVLIFVHSMPILFKITWCGIWLGTSVGAMIAFFVGTYDPLGIIYAAVVIMFLGSIGLVRFVDYRERKNLNDYSDLINYRKFLLFASADELKNVDYAEALPFLYAFRIKPLVARKYTRTLPPEIYCGDDRNEGALL